MPYVYEHWRPDTNECFYVGRGTHPNRAYAKSRRNSHWVAVVGKLERLGYRYEVKIVAEHLTSEEANKVEIERIAKWRDFGKSLVNVAPGGENCASFGFSGKNHSNEAKKAISEANRRRYADAGFSEPVIVSVETRKKISAARLGKQHTQAAIQKMSEIAKLRNAVKAQSLGDSKSCTNCKREKPMGDFTFDKRTLSGRASICRQCDAIKHRIAKKKA